MHLTEIKGIGPKTAQLLQLANINSFQDLIEIYPRTYRQYYATTTNQLQPNTYVLLKGKITRPINKRTSKTTTQLAQFTDSRGSITLRWFNSPYIIHSLNPNFTYLLKGKVNSFNNRLQIIAPQLTIINPNTPLRNQLIPIYRQLGSLKPWVLRTKIIQAIKTTPLPPDPLPTSIITQYSLMPYPQAIQTIHQPQNLTELKASIYRLSFQELYQLQLDKVKSTPSTKTIKPLIFNQKIIQTFIQSLPFKLTHSQQQALNTILEDLANNKPMHRLLAGEVGSGKTILATISALAVHTAGLKTIIMAPTVILATQLHQSITQFLNHLNLSISLFTSTQKGDLQADIIIGTHALISQSINNVGLTIIDEQHRFGVNQRNQLNSKSIHTLMMTATPIPRTLAQTLFSHLDITYLTELPNSRLTTKTFAISESKRKDAYNWIKTKLKHGNQVFWVVPLIEQAEENDTNPLKSLQQLKSQLTHSFNEFTLDIMHGKMKDAEKLQHMQSFRAKHTDILVATSMIEVGIDIPNANIIIVENAERFGLATLHQLRGRVGRGGKQGYCLLFSDSHTDKAQKRLQYFIRHTQGDKLALFDLKERGPGEIFGSIQSGFFNLKIANIYNQQLLQDTYQAVQTTLKSNS